MSERGGFRGGTRRPIFIVANAASALPRRFGGDFAFYNSFRSLPSPTGLAVRTSLAVPERHLR